jgi:hypothetical protein
MAAIALVAAFSGCGGGGETGTLSKAAFLKRASVICVQGTKELNRLDVEAWKKYGSDLSSPSTAELNKVALALLPARERELRRLRALGLPKGDEEYVEEMFAAWERGIEVGRKDPPLLQGAAGDFAFAKSYKMGIAYGLDKCWLA